MCYHLRKTYFSGGPDLDEDLKSIKSFLIKAKQLILHGDYILRGGRSKNKPFMEKYGLTRKDCARIVQSLHTSNRIAGPEEEERANRPLGTIFKFIKREPIDDQVVEIYIKLKIPDGEKVLEIISCHESSKED